MWLVVCFFLSVSPTVSCRLVQASSSPLWPSHVPVYVLATPVIVKGSHSRHPCSSESGDWLCAVCSGSLDRKPLFKPWLRICRREPMVPKFWGLGTVLRYVFLLLEQLSEMFKKSLNVVFACAEKGHLKATESVYLFWNSHHLKLKSTQLGVEPQEEKGRSNSVWLVLFLLTPTPVRFCQTWRNRNISKLLIYVPQLKELSGKNDPRFTVGPQTRRKSLPWLLMTLLIPDSYRALVFLLTFLLYTLVYFPFCSTGFFFAQHSCKVQRRSSVDPCCPFCSLHFLTITAGLSPDKSSGPACLPDCVQRWPIDGHHS